VEWTALLTSGLLLFAIVNPVGSIPIFLQLTSGMSREERCRAFHTAVLVSGAILIAFIAVGEGILTRMFGIELGHLMAAGGLLLLIIAIDHLVFGSLVRGVLGSGPKDAKRIGAVPMACPILAGPGAMMTVLVTHREHGLLVALLSLVVVLIITWAVLRFIDALYRLLGEMICSVLSKVLCLFIAAIGIRMLIEGLRSQLR